jgi:ABC-type Zn uptake system ZnuABC Zn-binding protein ZnuA
VADDPRHRPAPKARPSAYSRSADPITRIPYDKEALAQQVADLIQTIKSNQVHAIFVENMNDRA